MLKWALLWPLIQKAFPFILKFALRFVGPFSSAEEKAEARKRFIKFIQSKSKFARGSKVIHDEYKRQLEIGLEARKKRREEEREIRDEQDSSID